MMKPVTLDPFALMMIAISLATCVLYMLRAHVAPRAETPLTQTIYFEVRHMRCQATFFGSLDQEKLEKIAEMIAEPERFPAAGTPEAPAAGPPQADPPAREPSPEEQTLPAVDRPEDAKK